MVSPASTHLSHAISWYVSAMTHIMQRFSAVVAAFVVCSVAFADVITGKVVSVADGDTVTVLTPAKKQVKVRLDGVDAPEKAQAFGDKSKQFTSQMVFGKQVSVDVKETDRYGRSVGVVSVDGKNLNVALVSNGFAWWYREYAKDNEVLMNAESRARRERVGLWADANPVAPWDFRRGGTSSDSGVEKPSLGSVGSGVKSASDPVFVTKTGKKYHLDGCSGVSRTKIPSTRGAAERLGLQACSFCKP